MVKKLNDNKNRTDKHNPRTNPLPGGVGVGKNKTTMVRKILPYDWKLKALAKKLRQNMTLSEVLLWNELKNKKILGYDFDRQRPIGKYIVDFYCKELMLAIEVDGDSHDQKYEKDIERQVDIEKMGVHFLRFDDVEVKRDLQNVLREIEGWIEAFSKDEEGLTHPCPSREGNISPKGPEW
jgi:very-short-patch-repair endonuclease